MALKTDEKAALGIGAVAVAWLLLRHRPAPTPAPAPLTPTPTPAPVLPPTPTPVLPPVPTPVLTPTIATKATLIVDTYPVIGEIYLDGIYKGTAPLVPLTFDLDPGVYVVSFGEGEASGYRTPPPQQVTLKVGDIVAVRGTYELDWDC